MTRACSCAVSEEPISEHIIYNSRRRVFSPLVEEKMTINSNLWNATLKPRLKMANAQWAFERFDTPVDELNGKGGCVGNCLVIDYSSPFYGLAKCATWGAVFYRFQFLMDQLTERLHIRKIVVCVDSLRKNDARLYIGKKRAEENARSKNPKPAVVETPNMVCPTMESLTWNEVKEWQYPYQNCPNDPQIVDNIYFNSEWRENYLKRLTEWWLLNCYSDGKGSWVTTQNFTPGVLHCGKQDHPTETYSEKDAPSTAVEADNLLTAWALGNIQPDEQGKYHNVYLAINDGDCFFAMLQMDRMANNPQLRDSVEAKADLDFSRLYSKQLNTTISLEDAMKEDGVEEEEEPSLEEIEAATKLRKANARPLGGLYYVSIVPGHEWCVTDLWQTYAHFTKPIPFGLRTRYPIAHVWMLVILSGTDYCANAGITFSTALSYLYDTLSLQGEEVLIYNTATQQFDMDRGFWEDLIVLCKNKTHKFDVYSPEIHVATAHYSVNYYLNECVDIATDMLAVWPDTLEPFYMFYKDANKEIRMATTREFPPLRDNN